MALGSFIDFLTNNCKRNFADLTVEEYEYYMSEYNACLTEEQADNEEYNQDDDDDWY